jgi:uncharacterized protein with HEPN domain
LYASGHEEPFAFFDANDQKDFNACLLQLMHIGEQVNRLDESTRQMAPDIPWPDIKGLRNLIAHDYVGIDKFIVFKTVRTSLPAFSQQVEQLIQNGLRTGVFALTDYNLSKESNFYRHIDFSYIQ